MIDTLVDTTRGVSRHLCVRGCSNKTSKFVLTALQHLLSPRHIIANIFLPVYEHNQGILWMLATSTLIHSQGTELRGGTGRLTFSTRWEWAAATVLATLANPTSVASTRSKCYRTWEKLCKFAMTRRPCRLVVLPLDHHEQCLSSITSC